MVEEPVPRSASFAFDVARHALSEQLARIDSLDSKAGVLLAADGILVGLIFGRDTSAGSAPRWVIVAAGVGALLSLSCALRAFANRNYKIAPTPRQVARLAGASEDWVRWRLIGNMLDAVETNRDRLQRKTRWLAAGQLLLLVTLAPMGAYFLYAPTMGGA